MLKYKGELCPNIQDKLETLKIESRNCFFTFTGDKKFELDFYSTRHVVDLIGKTCSCRMWKLSYVPCNQAIAAIFANIEKPEAYVHAYFSKQTYLTIDKHAISPVPSQQEWKKTGLNDIYPPIPRKPAGRPKKK